MNFIQGSAAVSLIFVMIFIGYPGDSFADMARSPGAPPSYTLNRADEDYRYLRDPAWHADLWDPIKYVPLNEMGTWYITLGGKVRERYEYFNHPNWGKDPQDNGIFCNATSCIAPFTWGSTPESSPSFRAAWKTPIGYRSLRAGIFSGVKANATDYTKMLSLCSVPAKTAMHGMSVARRRGSLNGTSITISLSLPYMRIFLPVHFFRRPDPERMWTT